MKKLAYLVMWYLAWSTVSSLYWTKKWKDLKKELKKAKEEWVDDSTKVFIDNFVETQKNFFNDLKNMFESTDWKKFIEDKKEQIFSLIDKYKEDSESLIDDLKKKWKNYAGKTLEKLEDFYKEKRKEWEDFIKSIWWKDIDLKAFRDKLSEVYDELKTKLKK